MANAQEESVAEALFRAGREDLKRGAFAEACPKFAESQRLDPSPGTQLNLAVCQEGLGRVATAWTLLRTLSDTLPPDDERLRIAREHLENLEPRLPRIRVLLRPAPAAGVELRLNGAVLGSASLGVAFPIDPGEHQLEIVDQGGLVRREIVKIAPGERRDIVLSPRRDPPPTTLPPERKSEPELPLRSTSVWPAAGLATAGVGAVALGIGTYFALTAMDLNDQSNAAGRCSSDGCTPEGSSLRRRAGQRADVATVLFATGGALAVGGVSVFFLTRGENGAKSGAGSRAAGGGVTLRGTW